MNTVGALSVSLLVILFVVGCEKKVELQKFSSKKGRFSVMAPGTFEKSTITIHTNGCPVKCTNFVINKPHIYYIISYLDHPRETIESIDPDVLLVNIRNEMLKKLDGKLISEERIAYGKDPGVEIRYSVKDDTQTGHAVIILSGNRLYLVGALGTKSKFPSAAVIQYIDSFEIW